MTYIMDKSNILENIFFYVLQKIESHKGLYEAPKGEKRVLWASAKFLWECNTFAREHRFYKHWNNFSSIFPFFFFPSTCALSILIGLEWQEVQYMLILGWTIHFPNNWKLQHICYVVAKDYHSYTEDLPDPLFNANFCRPMVVKSKMDEHIKPYVTWNIFEVMQIGLSRVKPFYYENKERKKLKLNLKSGVQYVALKIPFLHISLPFYGSENI